MLRIVKCVNHHFERDTSTNIGKDLANGSYYQNQMRPTQNSKMAIIFKRKPPFLIVNFVNYHSKRDTSIKISKDVA